jgi:hypothetical protein
MEKVSGGRLRTKSGRKRGRGKDSVQGEKENRKKIKERKEPERTSE